VTSGKVATTIGYERRNNPALRFSDREAFVRFMTAGQPARPANLANIVAINQGRRPLTMGEPAAPAMAPAAVAEHIARGGIVIDTRSTAAVCEGTVPGSYHVHLTNPEFEQRIGWITPPDVPMVLVLGRESDAPVALRALAFLGLDARVCGYLAGGFPSWADAGYPLARLEQISPQDLHARIGNGNGIRVLDVREAREWDGRHIDGAANLSFKQLSARLSEVPFPREAAVAVVCEGGSSSATAASILRRHGFRQVVNLAGGLKAWTSAGLPVVNRAGPACTS
jgi:hydroxyacylglutathione hydrolase